MNLALRTLLNLLLAISLAVTPVSVTLAKTMDTNPGLHAHSLDAGPCHQSGHRQAPAADHERPAKTGPCNCCDDDGNCAGNTCCHHATASPLTIPATHLAVSLTAAQDLFSGLSADAFDSLNLAPDPPPPLA